MAKISGRAELQFSPALRVEPFVGLFRLLVRDALPSRIARLGVCPGRIGVGKVSTMKKNLDAAAELGFLERLLLGLDEGLPAALFRVGIGFATIPALRQLLGKHETAWTLLARLLTFLIQLRAVPMVIRKVVPFSQAVQIIWSNRRHLAKRYDSYQWRKVFWVGAGMAIYTSLSGDFSSSRITISSFCILAGAIGLIRWKAIDSRSKESTSMGRKIIRTVA
jgi:hypothetical protein